MIKSSFGMAVALFAVASLFGCSGEPAAADATGDSVSEITSGRPTCRTVRGNWQSHALPPAACTQSPVGFCAEGTLSGGLVGTYAFTMSSATPSPEPTTPTVAYYTGKSVITTPRGTITGTDNGVNNATPAGTNPSSGQFVAMIPIYEGSGALVGATGYLRLLGVLDVLSGTSQGTYDGQICTARGVARGDLAP